MIISDNKAASKKIGDIYRHIYKNQVTSRQNIADELVISLPTVSSYLNRLTKMGLIETIGEFESSGGRKANMISFVPNARYAVGIDVTREYYVIVLINLNLDIIDNRKYQIPYQDTNSYYMDLANHVELILADNQISLNTFLGIGISLPAIVDTNNHLVQYADLINIAPDFYDRLSQWLHHPFELYNDANSAGLAELWHYQSSSAIIYLSLSNSVGGAIMYDGNLLIGDHYRGAEFGHMCIVPHGKKCYCGKYGCLDSYCSAKNLTAFTNGDLNEFFVQLRNGNQGYKNVFQSYLEHLAFAVNNLRLCFDSDIVLGGNVGIFLSEYLDELKELLCNLSPYETNPDYLRICSFHTEPSAAGAALSCINTFIQEL